MDSLPDVAVHYQHCLDASQRRLRGTLTTASPVSSAAVDAVTQAIKKRLGADEVFLDATVDPSVLGGASLQVGDFRLDGSFASQLQTLRVG
jgi:F-type H+-transporting ATPase subunit delta